MLRHTAGSLSVICYIRYSLLSFPKAASFVKRLDMPDLRASLFAMAVERIGSRADLRVDHKLFALLTLAFVVSGCGSTSSENVKTQGIRAEIDVVAAGNGTTEVTVQLEVGSGGIGRTMLDLGPRDSLTVIANGIQKNLIKDVSVFGRISYVATYNFDDANTKFRVLFKRADGTNAPDSNVKLPPGFVVQVPTSSTVFAGSGNIDVVWAPSGTSIVPSVRITLTCTRLNGVRVSSSDSIPLSTDSGTASIPVAAVIPNGVLDTAQLCEGTVTLSRWRKGNLDPNYGEGGSIEAEQFQQGQFFVDLDR